jgi:hypothetical protein
MDLEMLQYGNEFQINSTERIILSYGKFFMHESNALSLLKVSRCDELLQALLGVIGGSLGFPSSKADLHGHLVRAKIISLQEQFSCFQRFPYGQVTEIQKVFTKS